MLGNHLIYHLSELKISSRNKLCSISNDLKDFLTENIFRTWKFPNLFNQFLALFSFRLARSLLVISSWCLNVYSQAFRFCFSFVTIKATLIGDVLLDTSVQLERWDWKERFESFSKWCHLIPSKGVETTKHLRGSNFRSNLFSMFYKKMNLMRFDLLLKSQLKADMLLLSWRASICFGKRCKRRTMTLREQQALSWRGKCWRSLSRSWSECWRVASLKASLRRVVTCDS